MLDKYKQQIKELDRQLRKNKENQKHLEELQSAKERKIKDIENQLNQQNTTTDRTHEKRFDLTDFNRICYLCGDKFDKSGHQRVILICCGDQFRQSCLAGQHAAGNHNFPTCSHVFKDRGF